MADLVALGAVGDELSRLVSPDSDGASLMGEAPVIDCGVRGATSVVSGELGLLAVEGPEAGDVARGVGGDL